MGGIHGSFARGGHSGGDVFYLVVQLPKITWKIEKEERLVFSKIK